MELTKVACLNICHANAIKVVLSLVQLFSRVVSLILTGWLSFMALCRIMIWLVNNQFVDAAGE